MARRLTQALGKDDIVARLGGDEFVVLLEDVTDHAAVSQMARQLLLALVREYPLDDQLSHVTASIGISLFPQNGANEFQLMKHADVAMYRAKDQGKNIFQFYSQQMEVDTGALLELESGLRHAIERNELESHYQPKLNILTCQVVGAEALLRWRHPRRGLLQPE